MKILFIIFSVALCTGADNKKWNQFKVKFNKKYSTSHEEARRFLIFKDNLRRIENHNEKFLKSTTKHKMGITRFADITEEEFFHKHDSKNVLKFDTSGIHQRSSLTGCCANYTLSRNVHIFEGGLNPPSRDFRTEGVVTEPRDMGDSTADYAYAISATLEIQLAIWNGTLNYLSPQYLLDCSDELADAYYKAHINGLPSDQDNPWIGKKGQCQNLCNGVCFDYSVLAREALIENSVGRYGPVSVRIDGGDLALYESGIIDGSNCYHDPHSGPPDERYWRKPWDAVIVGYGTENDMHYYILKNSWGTSWGEGGYFRLIKGALACGIERFMVVVRPKEPPIGYDFDSNF